MTPAEQLRAAAAKLREAAAKVECWDYPAGGVTDWRRYYSAELGERQAELVKHHVDGGPCRDTACRTVHAALAVARAVLGETS